MLVLGEREAVSRVQEVVGAEVARAGDVQVVEIGDDGVGVDDVVGGAGGEIAEAEAGGRVWVGAGIE